MSFQHLKTAMYWPDSEEVFSPSGAGPRVLVKLAKDKIGKSIERKLDGSANVKVGLLTKAPSAGATVAPIAVVCEFNRPISNEQLAETHRLAWNFSRAPLLITVEPNLVRTWSCCEVPAANDEQIASLDFQIREASLEFDNPESLSQSAAHALNWVRLASGDFYRQFPERFKRDGRADQTLLNELKDVRQKLALQNLPKDTIHDLIARVIFTQFLFDRKDSEGRSAISPALLSKLYDEGKLKQLHVELPTILADFKEAYRFFQWLNDKFNGDLFPGKGATKTAREAEWRAEKKIVEERHLQTLANFVSGTVSVKSRQQALWRQYSFDVIPLEFISSVYEEFVTDNSAHYTPGFLVDFMLDGVLPWDGDDWDLQILDPACGSGIFLVKAYQRLIQRWKNANNDEQPTPTILRKILERNLFGVDKDPHAVRVASFSLYLTMCDEIDPKNYLSVWKFPRMRGERLIDSDFFAEGVVGFDTVVDAKSYDLVIGNAPWGKDTVTEAATNWANGKEHKWEIANKAIGTLFLAKAAELTKVTGCISMIQPASALLFNRSGKATRFRDQLFSTYQVAEIVSLATLRFELFENAVSPPCIVTLAPVSPDGELTTFISPKQIKQSATSEIGESNYAVIIDPSDVTAADISKMGDSDLFWTACSWGGPRDLALIRKLMNKNSLLKIDESGKASRRKGIVRGDRKKKQPAILGRRILESPSFPAEAFLQLHANRLPVNKDAGTESASSTKMGPFNPTQLIFKKSWQAGRQRLQAVIVIPDAETGGAICSQSYVSVHVGDEFEQQLENACAVFNSTFAVFYLLLTSGRLASYRPEALVEEILALPIPDSDIELRSIHTYEQLDAVVLDSLNLKASERALVEDAVRFTMADFKGDTSSPGRQLTQRNAKASQTADREPDLHQYCQYFLRVLNSAGGDSSPICATVFQDSDDQRLPIRLVAFYLDLERDEEISVETIDSDDLCYLLNELNDKYIQIHGDERGGIFFQRVARVYMEQKIEGVATPVVYVVKPDRVRYWTRSAGLRDADEVAADAQHWRIANPPTYDQAEA